MDKPEVREWFQQFQKELDEKHDKYERIVKLSRDATIESKRVIFQLHRITTLLTEEEKSNLFEQSALRLKGVQNSIFRNIAKELVNEDHYNFVRGYSGGLQEYIEAITFYYYLKENRLLSLAEIQEELQFTNEEGDVQPVLIPITEYLCGIGDIAGEVMRYAINAVSAGDLTAPNTVAAFLKNLYNGFVLLGIRPHV